MASMSPGDWLADPRHVPVDHVRLLLEKAESIGLSSTRLLRRCRLSYNLDDLCAGRVSRVPIADFARVRHACLIEIRQRIAPSHYAGMSRDDFDFMCHSLITSTTLHEMLERQSRFFEIGGRRDGWSTLSVADDRATFEIHLGPAEGQWEFFFVMNAFSVFSRLIEWAVGEPIEMSYLTSCPRDPENRAIAAIFGNRCTFRAPAHQMIFPARLLDRAVVRTPADLREFLRRFPFDAVVSMETSTDLSSRIGALYRHAILNHQPLPTIAGLSRQLGIANATLRRRLDAEGVSIRVIKDEVRAALAREFLSNDYLPVGDVASTLGFSGAKAFTRAFRGWTGVTPAFYRRACESSNQPVMQH
ncbi:helix-turn-helix domain-containing protein [Flavisphingomonas formosensis]|uniref:helix-turn-helix domain-containing protein n=1 Tax=Flavisphingomonas formosensis TaxID=861534 RepID=UPI0012FB122F|nr:AraC family transcriptional regulator [Sphingomonas formosensis]